MKGAVLLAKVKPYSNRVLFACYALVMLFGVVGLFYALIGFCADAWGVVPVACAIVPILVGVALFVRLMLQWKIAPERVFLLVAIPGLLSFGMFFLPDHIPDEAWHAYRVFSIEDPGTTMVIPAMLWQPDLPKSYTEAYQLLTSDFSWSDTLAVDRDMSTYLTHLYLVPGLAVKVCMLIGVNPYAAIYVARFSNALLFLVVGYWIIRTIPMAKVCMCVYLLNPMLIQQEASCSADAVTNIVTMFFIAYLLKVRFQDVIQKRDWVVLVAVFIVVCLSKYVYALLVFLFLLLVPKCQDRKVRTALYAASAVCVTAALVFVFFFMESGRFQSTLDLIRNPPEFAAVLAKTFYEVGPSWISQFGGMTLSNLDLTVWAPCFWGYMLVLLFSLVFNLGEERSLRRLEKIGVMALVVFVTISVVLVFRDWALKVEHRSDVILGSQGRYYIPFFELILICLSTPRASLVRKNCLLLYGGVIACIYAIDALSILRFFA